jgi:SAM-dependent methyltransferase
MKLSQNHTNRRPHNWLIYDVGDQFLAKASSHYKGTLYDLGAGESPYRDFFLQHAEHYVAVDWGGSQHNTKADIAADLNKPLPIATEVADTVVSLSVMEHLCEPQVFLTESYRILKPGGAMVLQVPFMWRVHEAPYDYFRYTEYGLRYMFEKAGFSNITISPQTGFWVMWTLKFNYQSASLIRGPWPVRKGIALLMRIVWAIDQRVAPFLDKHWKSEGETSGYFVIAHKSNLI